MPPDRRSELGDPIRVEVRARLLGVGANALERYLTRADGLHHLWCGGRCRPLPEEHVEAASETCACHQAIAPASGIGSRAFRRVMSSRANSADAFAARVWGSYTLIGFP